MKLGLLGMSSLGLCALTLILVTGQAPGAEAKAVMCYFGSWSVYRYRFGKFDVEDIDPFICTHLMFGFAGLDPVTFEVSVLDPYNELYDEWGRGAFQRFTGLKNENPALVTYLAIGGWNEGNFNISQRNPFTFLMCSISFLPGASSYSDMALTFERRKIFIDSCVSMALAHGFDGIDMDWEYPGT